MRQFVLRQNVARFQRALEAERDDERRRPLRDMLSAARRELALLDAELLGAQAVPARSSAGHAWREHPSAGSFRGEFDNARHPCIVLDPRPGLAILDLNAAHRGATHTGRDAIGRPLFETFPDDPANPGEAIFVFYDILRAAADSGEQQTMPAYRYDVREPDGRFVKRYWRSEITPLLGDEGRLLFLLHKAEDVTSEVIRAGMPCGAPALHC